MMIFLALFIQLSLAGRPSTTYVTDCSRKTSPWVQGQVGYVVCNQGSCGTIQIGTLSQQIYNNTACNSANSWSSMTGVAGMDTSGSGISQFPYLQKAARDALVLCVNA